MHGSMFKGMSLICASDFACSQAFIRACWIAVEKDLTTCCQRFGIHPNGYQSLDSPSIRMKFGCNTENCKAFPGGLSEASLYFFVLALSLEWFCLLTAFPLDLYVEQLMPIGTLVVSSFRF